MSNTDEIGKGRLEGLDLFTKNIPAALQDARYGAGQSRAVALNSLREGRSGGSDQSAFSQHEPSQIARQMSTILVKRPTKPIGEADAQAPTGDCTKSVVVGYEVTDIDALALRRKLPDSYFPPP